MFGRRCRKRGKEFREKSLTLSLDSSDICSIATAATGLQLSYFSFPPKKEDVSLRVDEELDIQFLCKQPS